MAKDFPSINMTPICYYLNNEKGEKYGIDDHAVSIKMMSSDIFQYTCPSSNNHGVLFASVK